MEQNPKVAMYIDGDNVSAKMASEAIEIVKQKYPSLKFIKAYGNWAGKGAWKGLSLSHGLNLVQRFSHSKGKNATDIALAVDATGDISNHAFDVLVVMSSDGDFMPLVQYVQQLGKVAVGIGERKAPAAYTGLCDDFIFLENNIH